MTRFALFASSCLALLLRTLPSEATLNFGSSCGHEASHDYHFGQKHPLQHLLYMDHPKYDAKLLRVRTEDLTYPVKGQNSTEVIAYIEVLDMKKDGTGGCVYIKNGGVGSSFVTLHFKSQRNHGMEFMIKIYGNKV